MASALLASTKSAKYYVRDALRDFSLCRAPGMFNAEYVRVGCAATWQHC